MGRQLDDPSFDPENDEWVGGRPIWDSQSQSNSGAGGSQGTARIGTKQKAPSIDPSDFRVVFDRFDQGGLAMTYQRCLTELHDAGYSHLELDHVTLVAELSQVRARTREWTGVPAKIRNLGVQLAAQRMRRKSKRR